MSETIEAASPAEFVSVGEAAVRLGVATTTVRRWCNEGHLATWRTMGQHRRVSVASIEDLLAARGIAS